MTDLPEILHSHGPHAYAHRLDAHPHAEWSAMGRAEAAAAENLAWGLSKAKTDDLQVTLTSMPPRRNQDGDNDA